VRHSHQATNPEKFTPSIRATPVRRPQEAAKGERGRLVIGSLAPATVTFLSDVLPRFQHFEYLVHAIRGTMQVSKYPAREDPPPNILRQSLERNWAQQGHMAGLRQLELSVLP
jgi:hypothetical protein